ncbi:MAG: hypothetical protein ACUVQY_10635 [Thermoproteota archaeon]
MKITEFVQYVEEALHERINDLTVILISHPYIRGCTDLAEQAVSAKCPHIHFRRYELGFEDLDSEEKVYEFMIEMAKLLKDQVKKYDVDNLHKCCWWKKRFFNCLIDAFFPISHERSFPCGDA